MFKRLEKTIQDAIRTVIKSSGYDFDKWYEQVFDTDYHHKTKEDLQKLSASDLAEIQSDWVCEVLNDFAEKVCKELGIRLHTKTESHTALVEEIFEITKVKLLERIAGTIQPDNRNVVYIAELDADVDDVIAAEYLYRKGVLKEVVCDPPPKTLQGKERRKMLKDLGIKVSSKMPAVAKYVFVGGALTELSRYLVNHKIEYLVMNGGFVGSNIVKEPLEKFKGKKAIRTFNFNCDVHAADKVLKSKNIEAIVLVGKNICHSEKNTIKGVWAEEKELLDKYHAKSDKRQHDMLACREGLILIGLLNEASHLVFKKVYPYNTGLKGNMTQWGSTLDQKKSPYQPVLAAIDWK